MKRVVALLAFSMLLFGGVAHAADSEFCEKLAYGDTPYVVCTPPLDNAGLRLFWKDSEGHPYRRFSAVAEALAQEGETLVFAFNAGMYFENFAPMGLYVEDGSTRVQLNTHQKDGPASSVPNFYKAPNGVFYLSGQGPGLVTTQAFADAAPEAVYATQSGPMLVIDGAVHPAFIKGSSDRKRRTGIGLCADGKVEIAISDSPVNFYDFALFFKDRLDCPNALFLDGGRGAGIYSPQLGRNDISWHGGFGPIIGFVR